MASLMRQSPQSEAIRTTSSLPRQTGTLDPARIPSHPRMPSSWPIALVIFERNSGVRLEARFALAAEYPDHDAYERSDKDKQVDCPNHVGHLAISIADRL
jgi:hypothetical protein